MLDNTLLRMVLGAVVFVWFGRWASRHWEIYQFKRRTGAKSIRTLPNTGFLGLKWLRENEERALAGTIVDTFNERYAQCGETYGVTVAGMPLYTTMDVDNIKAMLGDKENWGVGERPGLGGWGPAVPSGIFVTDGREWEHGRALVKPAVTKGEISQLGKMEKHVQRLLAGIPDGATVNLQERFQEFTMDSGLDLLLGVGTSENLTAAEAADKAAFGKAVGKVFSDVFMRQRTPGWLRSFYWRANREFANNGKIMHRYIDQMVDIAAQRLAAQEKGGALGDDSERGYVFADELLRAAGGDRMQARWELLTLLAAASDTTALLISNTFHVLARRPDIWEKLQAEVAQLEGRLPDYEIVKGMRYLKAVINETFRIHPIVGNNVRWARNDAVLPRGGGPDGQSKCFVPKHGLVLMSYHALLLKKDVYGPDADEFRPERWLDAGLRPGYNFLPFSAGARACPGQNLAHVEASYVIIRMLQTFSSIENRDPRPFFTKVRVSWINNNGVLVGMKRR